MNRYPEKKGTTRRGFRAELLKEVSFEFDRQFKKWGEQDHSKEKWLSILIEEIGEVATVDLEGENLDHYIDELIQVAAVAISAAANALWKENQK